MKILCLHGQGTSTEIFKKQLEAFFKELGHTYDYEFVSGELTSPPAPGVTSYFSGPYYAYFKTPYPADILRAHELVNDIIAEEGPFDGVLGFSQGASIAASLLLQHAIDHPDVLPPFKFAVFFSTYLAFSPDSSFHQDAAIAFAAESSRSQDSSSRSAIDDKAVDQLKLQSSQLGFPYSVVQDFSSAIKAANRTGLAPQLDYTLSPDQYPRPFHPDLLTQRITIPTAHIFGSEDPYNTSAKVVQRLCAGKVVKSVIHGGGHELPRTKEDIKAAKTAVESVIDQSRYF